MAGTDTIEVYFGEDVEMPFAMSPVEDVTGWGITMTVRGAGITLEIEADIAVGVSGLFSFPLTNDDYVDTFRAGTYSYDVWRTDEGEERCIAAGLFKFLRVARVVVD